MGLKENEREDRKRGGNGVSEDREAIGGDGMYQIHRMHIEILKQ